MCGSGKATEADKFLDSVLQASPNNPDAQVLKGSLLLARNEEDQARKAFETAIERSPSHPAGYLALANLHINKGRLGEAQSILERGRASTSEDFSLRFRLAEVLEASGNVGEALEFYETLLKERPDNLVLVNNVASLISDHQTDSQEHRSGLRSCLPAQGRGRSPVQGYARLALLLEAGLPRRGVTARRIGEGPRRNPLVHYHLGTVYGETGDLQKAEAALSRAQELAKDDAALGRKIAQSLTKLQPGTQP